MWHVLRLRQKANGGDPIAQHELGVRYFLGRGVVADTVAAAFWTGLAAEQNMTPARFNMAILQTNGWGVEWNPFLAYTHLLYCAEKGLPEAQFSLAQFLTDNLVVPRDWPRALQWLESASDSGFIPARDFLDELRQRGRLPVSENHSPPFQDNTAKSTGIDWSPVFLDFTSDTTKDVDDRDLVEALRREGLGEYLSEADAIPDSLDLSKIKDAANAGNPEALVFLGRVYEVGSGVSPDPIKATSYYVRAIRADSPHAPELLWNLLEGGNAVNEIRKAATHGVSDAQFCLAGLQAIGFQFHLLRAGSAMTDSESIRVLRSLAGSGHVPAMIELGLCHYLGRWVQKNTEEARHVWRKASELGSVEARTRLAAVGVSENSGNPGLVVEALFNGITSGSSLAQLALALCYEKGYGVDLSFGKAVFYYKAAARRGSRDAYQALIRLHDGIRPPGNEFRINRTDG